MNFLDLFAGIGGFRIGMEMAGHKCIGFVEWDKYARKSYMAMHNTEGEWTANDIRAVTDDDIRLLGRERGPIQVICGGFPCQAFSIAGKRKGFEDTRGTLFFEIARFASILRPKYLFLENVAGLLNHDIGNTFEVILRTLDELGYNAEWQVCNSKDFGVPQNRERVFIIGHLRGEPTGKVFPIQHSNNETSLKFVGGVKTGKFWLDDGKNYSRNWPQGNRVYSADGLSSTLSSQGGGLGAKTGLYLVNHNHKSRDSKNGWKEICPTLMARDYKGPKEVLEVRPCLTPNRPEKRQNGRRFKEPGEPMFTLTAQDIHGVAYQIKDGTKKGYTEFTPTTTTTLDLSVPSSTTRRGRVKDGVTPTLDTGCNVGVFTDYRIRKLTPRECFRLQGFSDEYFDRAQAVNSDSQLYKQAGNSVTVNVIYEIARRLN